MTARYKAWVCGRSLAAIVGSIPAGGIYICLLRVFFYKVEVSVSGWSPIQRNPTDYGVYNCVLSWGLDNEKAVTYWWLLRQGRGIMLACESEISCAKLISIAILAYCGK